MNMIGSKQSKQMALCGLMVALSVVILSLGSLIPFATFACPLLAMVCLIPIVCEYGARTALLPYGAAAFLGLLLCADREAALLYVFLGWYPALRPWLERFSRLPRLLMKCALFSLSVTVMYLLILYIFRLEAVVEEFYRYSIWMTIGLLAVGNMVFLLFDRTLGTLSLLVRRRRK